MRKGVSSSAHGDRSRATEQKGQFMPLTHVVCQPDGTTRCRPDWTTLGPPEPASRGHPGEIVVSADELARHGHDPPGQDPGHRSDGGGGRMFVSCPREV